MVKRAVEVYREYRQKTSEVQATNEVRVLQKRILELQMEIRILKKLLNEK